MRARNSAVVRAASWLALAGTVHAALNARLLRRPGGTGSGTPVSVLVPARNEARNIVDCLRALAGSYEVLVLDDRSDDATATLASSAGARVLTGTPPPDGWLGKAWACAQLVEAADANSEVLVFVDADVRLAPGAVAAAVGLLERHGLDIVCPVPRQLAGTAVERLVQPLVQWSWLTTLPLRVAERSARPSLTAACGQFVVVRCAALTRAGGFASVRADVLDDVALVRAIKAAGGRGGVADGCALAGCRMYVGWIELRDGYSKSLWSAFGGDAGAAAVVAALGFVWVLPAAAALRGSRAGLAGYAAGVAGRVIAARSTGGRVVPDALAHPLSVVVFGWLTARSVVLHRRGALQWKGRPVAFAAAGRSRPRLPRSIPPR
ncbi:glycosyltransferase [uncultured Jatrophihabitans sp.]|uniref:glycosyltransferase n=1 Tax=uncultured Jatrophihabitans sp. TaxID=1610747 RepID=UPI0035C99F24